MNNTVDTYAVSVIVPVYGVERYIERCARSLFTQTLDNIQYIFVDDCSRDSSMDILRRVMSDFPGIDERVSIVSLPQNMGQAGARNAGLEHARGEYIIHCDPDDWVDADYYEKMYAAAKQADADMVVGDFYFEYGTHSEICAFIPNVTDWKSFCQYQGWHLMSLVNRLVHSRIISDNGLRFYPGVNYSEDVGFMVRVYYYCKTIVRMGSGAPCYHYSKYNESAITRHQFEPAQLSQRRECLTRLTEFLEEHGENPASCNLLMLEKRDLKEGYLKSTEVDYRAWRSAFPEVNAMVYADPAISAVTKLFWRLAHSIHPSIYKYYISMTKMLK